jgi:hypothetical protein
MSVQGEGEFGCFVIFYVCTVTLGGSSAPLCGSYLLYSHCLILCGGVGGCGEGVILLFLSSLRCCNLVFYLLGFCMVQLICSVHCWRHGCAAGFVWRLSCEDLMVSSVCNGVRNTKIGYSLAQSVVCFECKYCTAAVSSVGRVTSLSNGVSAIIGRYIDHMSRSQWPRRLRRRSAAARLQRLWV